MDDRGRHDAKKPRLPLHALLGGGGTGGHVFPALAVAEELLSRGWRVSFTGSPGGLEARLVAERGLPFHPLAARPLVGRGPLAKARALATLAISAAAAARLARKLGVQVALGTGGYASAPAVLGARLARRPAVLLEPNARAGVANRWLSRWATAAAVGYPVTAGELHCPATVTGVPVRRAFFAVPPLSEIPGAPAAPAPAEISAAPAAPAPAEASAGSPRLLVLGGSQGARQINEAMAAAAPHLFDRLPALRIVHQAGARHVAETRQAYARQGVGEERVEVVPFLDDMAGAMAASHLLVSRAGAVTVAEICAAGRPSLLLPLAIARGHQVDNARLLASAGAAELLSGEDTAAERLGARLLALLVDGERLAAMGRAARALARPGATAAIADLLAELAAPTAPTAVTGPGAGGAR
jgi:UDP-N-acetylglucosamine--N-acetylmuramyl-(pentapeptide) pyrophosphoryl-undecaprenol N-acetylglucosamine transferase